MRNQKLIYISGKITGLTPEQVKYEFDGAEFEIEALHPNYGIINPSKLPDHSNHDKSWVAYMRVDITWLMKCDAVYMLKNWQDSKGAVLEHTIAQELGMTIIYQ